MSGDQWQMYVLECNDSTYYCGASNDVFRRVEAHNGLRVGGSKYTRGKRPVRLIASWPYPDKSSALAAEYRFKQLSKKKKRFFLANPGEWE